MIKFNFTFRWLFDILILALFFSLPNLLWTYTWQWVIYRPYLYRYQSMGWASFWMNLVMIQRSWNIFWMMKLTSRLLNYLWSGDEAIQENRVSSSSQKPRKKKIFIRRDREEAHQRLHQDFFATMNLIFLIDFRCEETYSFA